MVPEGFFEVRQITGAEIAEITAAMYLGGLEDAERQLLHCSNVCRDGFGVDVYVLGILVNYLRIEREKYRTEVLKEYGPDFLACALAHLARSRFAANVDRQFDEKDDGFTKEDRPPERNLG